MNTLPGIRVKFQGSKDLIAGSSGSSFKDPEILLRALKIGRLTTSESGKTCGDLLSNFIGIFLSGNSGRGFNGRRTSRTLVNRSTGKGFRSRKTLV